MAGRDIESQDGRVFVGGRMSRPVSGVVVVQLLLQALTAAPAVKDGIDIHMLNPFLPDLEAVNHPGPGLVSSGVLPQRPPTVSRLGEFRRLRRFDIQSVENQEALG